MAKCYLNDPDSEGVRNLVRAPAVLYSSVICIAEVSSAIHRRVRERSLLRRQALEIGELFRADVESGVWRLVPASEFLLWEVHETLRSLPARVFLRSADAIHLASVRAAGLSEVWTNDRQMLRAARYFGLQGRSA
ncbi:MAG: type II toxin-antitoxin system VapC family toxin [Acidobacteria bacterium]|nr:type II toxin-antitoxin system VapC family toxin [Acidobacteriota bacterium]